MHARRDVGVFEQIAEDVPQETEGTACVERFGVSPADVVYANLRA